MNVGSPELGAPIHAMPPSSEAPPATRNLEPAAPTGSTAPRTRGRNVIAVIGIDGYRHWRRLTNAVSDARGALALFQQLGFEEASPAMFDAAATSDAMRALVVDDLKTLGADDSLVVFYAGHGGCQSHHQSRATIKTGYLIPVDADPHKVSTWVDLESWLRSVSLLPPRHILVILDACHSGIALDPVIKWRDDVHAQGAPLETLRMRRSRRVITSALDDERAADAGPVPGHSLFTGCLIEALTAGLSGTRGIVTGSEIAIWVQNRVRTYPGASQTPDFGTFGLDDRGEIMIPVLAAPQARPLPTHLAVEAPAKAHRPAATSRSRVAKAAVRRLRKHGEWLMIVVPLTVISLIGLLARAC
jgi:hypothetical protein